MTPIEENSRADGNVGIVRPDQPLTHRNVLAIAIPITISNATTPLIGFTDTVVIGQTGEAHLIGGVAIGALIFSMLYWSFSFLRMGTTGLTAQAVGEGNGSEIAANLWRSVIVGTFFGLVIIALQEPILRFSLAAVGGSPAVEGAVRDYYGWRIWAAPAGLVNFALLGWFIGLGRAKLAFWIQLFLNGLNIVLAIGLGISAGWAVKGVGAAALIAEVAAAILGLAIAVRELARTRAYATLAEVITFEKLARSFAVNRDIMIRSLVVFMTQIFFASQGAAGGDVVLAANATLNNICHITIYLLDGFAFAAETLVGQSIGARLKHRFDEAVRLSTLWAAVMSVILGAVIWLFGPMVIDFMTTNPEVRADARTYLIWAALSPVFGVWCFQLDGIFIGATRTADMRNMMILSVPVFFATWWLLRGYGNHGLWIAYLTLFVARAATLLARYPALVRHWFGPQAPSAQAKSDGAAHPVPGAPS